MQEMSLKALAKINLGLDVLGRRDNGYHDVRMVMQSIYLYDDVFLKKTKEEGVTIETNWGFLPVNENNIAYKAAKLLMEEFSLPEGFIFGFVSIFRCLPGWQEEVRMRQQYYSV